MRIILSLVLASCLSSAALAADILVSELPQRFNEISRGTGQKVRMVQKECLPDGLVHVCTEAVGTSLSAIVSARDDRKLVSGITLVFHGDPKMDEWVTAVASLISTFSPEIDRETKGTAFMALIRPKADGSIDNTVSFDKSSYQVKKIDGIGVFFVVDSK